MSDAVEAPAEPRGAGPDDAVPDGAAPSAGRRSPLDAVHAAAGAQFTDFAGWRMPLRYGSELAEHRAVREAAGLFDLSHMGEIAVSGIGAADALDHALLGDFSALEPGRAKYSLLLNEAGGIVDDLVVYRTDFDRFLVVANAVNAARVAALLVERARGFRASVEDDTDEVGLLALQGPLSAQVLAAVPGLEVDGGDLAGALAALRNYRFIGAVWQGAPVLLARTGYTGELGFELYTAPDVLPALWTAILEAGGGVGVLPVGLAARDTLRLEAGMPLYGQELTEATRPEQVGLGRLVRPEKAADYVGRAALQGPAEDRVLVGLVGEGRRAARAGYPVLQGDRVVGVVTSGALSPTIGRPIAVASIEAEAVDGLAVDVRGTRLPVEIVPLPFLARRKA